MKPQPKHHDALYAYIKVGFLQSLTLACMYVYMLKCKYIRTNACVLCKCFAVCTYECMYECKHTGMDV